MSPISPISPIFPISPMSPIPPISPIPTYLSMSVSSISSKLVPFQFPRTSIENMYSLLRSNMAFNIQVDELDNLILRKIHRITATRQSTIEFLQQ